MKALLTLVFSILLAGQGTEYEKVIGDWEGKLSAGGATFRIVFHIKMENDKLSATMDSPDQNQFGIQMSEASFKDNVLNIKLTVAGIDYTGTLKDGKVEGKWTQSGQTFDLNLEKVKKKGKS